MRLTLIHALWVRVRVLSYRFRFWLRQWPLKWLVRRMSRITQKEAAKGYAFGGYVREQAEQTSPFSAILPDSGATPDVTFSWRPAIGTPVFAEGDTQADPLVSRAVARIYDPIIEGAPQEPPPGQTRQLLDLFNLGVISHATLVERLDQLSANNPWLRETWNLTRQAELARTAPELAAQLQREAITRQPAPLPPKPRVVFVTRTRRKLRLQKQ